MKRRRIPLLSLLSLALLVTVVVLWARSRRHADIVGLFPPSGHLQAIGSDRGGLILFASDIPWGREYALSADTMSVPREEVQGLHDDLFDPTRKKWALLGFHFAHGNLTTLLPSTYSALTVPYWSLVIVLGFLPLLMFRGSWLRWRRKRRGLCLTCGYDVRESADRCPECGEPLVVRRAKTAPA